MARKKEVMIRVDPDKWDELKLVAAEEGVSLSEYMRRLLDRSLAQKRVGQASSA